MLSSRLKAFVEPISQMTAIASPSTALWTSWTCVPVASTIAAAALWAASFAERRQPPEVVGEPGARRRA